ncbi:hypothetical protein BC628DRAFT_82875 [Trametes gibbosa]|nr:hypothetical protein BC628DRAFT_82875 [Trametes gibbosa]
MLYSPSDARAVSCTQTGSANKTSCYHYVRQTFPRAALIISTVSAHPGFFSPSDPHEPCPRRPCHVRVHRPESALHLPLPASDSTAGRGRSSSILSMKNGVILLVIVNLLVWVFAVRYLRYIVSVFEDALADQRVETRALPRPDPLDGLLEFLEAKRVAGGK